MDTPVPSNGHGRLRLREALISDDANHLLCNGNATTRGTALLKLEEEDQGC